MRVLVTVLLVSLTSCSSAPELESLCNVAHAPDRYLERPLTISGLAKMDRHGTLLTDPACPERGLILWGTDHEGADSAFWSAVAGTLAPNMDPIRVTVTGQIAHRSALPPSVFRVTRGAAE